MVQTSADRNSAAPSGRAQADGDDQSGRLASVSRTAADAFQAARERTSTFYGSARDTARGAGRRTVEGIESNPMAIVVGGLAVGALIGALVPASRRERELFGPVGRRITDTAREAALAARDAGREQLDDFTDRAMETVRAAAARGEGKD
jgi:ElaB/YqjD/DUF883 family membrane-anchored ribosome-binding protein